MIKYTMNDCNFRDMMNSEGSDYANQFSYEGLGLLFEHLSELEGDYEFEKIGICCDWTEYKNIEAAERAYSKALDGDTLEENTIVLKDDSGIVIVQNF